VPLKLLRSKFREAWICLSAGRVTLPYPYAPADPAPGFRGLPVVDASRCIGCGGCASVCTPGLIAIADDGPRARFTWSLARCTYCARCAEACPEDAVTMSPGFETATGEVGDLTMTVEVFMGSCNRCGRCYRTITPLDAPYPRTHHEARLEAICDRYRPGVPAGRAPATEASS
jgi:hydrogenase-4 component H